MFKKKHEEKVSCTVVSQGIRLESAKLTGSEPVNIEGTYVGSIDLDGDLMISATGNVIGSIRAKYIVIEGRVTGNVRCDNTVHLTPTAHVEGSIETKALKTDEGAHFSGQCQMGGDGTTGLTEAEESIAFDFTKLRNVYIPESGPPEIYDDEQKQTS